MILGKTLNLRQTRATIVSSSIALPQRTTGTMAESANTLLYPSTPPSHSLQRAVSAYLFLLLAVCAVGQSTPKQRIQPMPSDADAAISEHRLRAPIKAEQLAEKAGISIARNDLQSAKTYLYSSLKEYPDYSVALTLRGLIRINEHNDSAGFSDLTEAIAVDPSYGLPYLILGSAYNDRDRYRVALEYLEKGVQLLPRTWQAHYELARASAGLEKFGTALQEVTAAVRLADSRVTPENRASTHLLRARLLLRLQNLAEARSELEQAVKCDPGGRLADVARSEIGRLLVRAQKGPVTDLGSRE